MRHAAGHTCQKAFRDSLSLVVTPTLVANIRLSVALAGVEGRRRVSSLRNESALKRVEQGERRSNGEGKEGGKKKIRCGQVARRGCGQEIGMIRSYTPEARAGPGGCGKIHGVT